MFCGWEIVFRVFRKTVPILSHPHCLYLSSLFTSRGRLQDSKTLGEIADWFPFHQKKEKKKTCSGYVRTERYKILGHLRPPLSSLTSSLTDGVSCSKFKEYKSYCKIHISQWNSFIFKHYNWVIVRAKPYLFYSKLFVLKMYIHLCV